MILNRNNQIKKNSNKIDFPFNIFIFYPHKIQVSVQTESFITIFPSICSLIKDFKKKSDKYLGLFIRLIL